MEKILSIGLTQIYLKISEKGLTQNPKCVAAPATDCILRGSGSGP